MKFQEVKVIAKTKGIETGSLKKPDMIRAIQKSEGNFDCFGSTVSGDCDQMDCMWRKDCLESSKKTIKKRRST